MAISELPAMQMGDGLLCRAASPPPHRRPIEPSLRSTAVALLGLLRAEDGDIDSPLHTGALRTRVLGALGHGDSSPGVLGLVLWSESRGDGGAVQEIISVLDRHPADGLERLSLAELSWLVAGLAECEARYGPETLGAGERLLEQAVAALAGRRLENGLHQEGGPKGLRPRLVGVASQFHAAHALVRLGRSRSDERAFADARRAAERLMALQRPDGAWPAVVEVRTGQAVATYPVRSGLQGGVAPLALRSVAGCCEELDVAASIHSGLAWLFGANPIGHSLVHAGPSHLDSCLFATRRNGALAKRWRAWRRRLGREKELAVANVRADPNTVTADLGWILEAWAGRENLPASVP